jgi:GntR family transcriptional regulator / MocR family aminotransferase
MDHHSAPSPDPLRAIALERNGRLPLYVQLYRQLRGLILRGDLPPGQRLPPSRRLAADLAVARVTITQAYEQLRDEDFVIARPGAGLFVADDLADVLPVVEAERSFLPPLSRWGQQVMAAETTAETAVSAPRPAIDFGFGRSFAQIFPYDVWRRLLARYLGADDAILARYGSVAGFEPLRAALADYLARQRGVRCTPEQSRHRQWGAAGVGYSGPPAAQSRRRGAGGDAWLYGGLRFAARLRGQAGRPAGGRRGLSGGAESRQDSQGAIGIFVTPTHQFPAAARCRWPRRLRLLRWAQERMRR